MDQPEFLFGGDERFTLVLTLLRRVLHDLNNPISTIDSSAGFLLSVDADPERRRRMLEIIQAEARRLKSMTASMGQLTRAEKPRPVPMLAQALVSRLTLDHRAGLSAVGIQFELEPPPETLQTEVFTDQALVSFVVGNLLTNARQAIKASAAEGRIRLELLVGPAFLDLEVADSGPGIPPAFEPHLFQAFRSGRENGLGLGLYVSQQAAASMHADLSLVTPRDPALGGARFRLRIPRRAL
jgi:signal transduction histidine kinase